MPSPEAVYPAVLCLIEALGGPPHAAARRALAQLVAALLRSQRLTATALMRVVASPVPVPARQRYKRVARALGREWLTPAWLTPRLVRAALALVPDPVPHLALDTVRLGCWEAFTVGVVWHGRVLPVGWAVLPYPLPRGRFTPTTCALLRRLAAAWPPDRARPTSSPTGASPAGRSSARSPAWAGAIPCGCGRKIRCGRRGRSGGCAT